MPIESNMSIFYRRLPLAFGNNLEADCQKTCPSNEKTLQKFFIILLSVGIRCIANAKALHLLQWAEIDQSLDETDYPPCHHSPARLLRHELFCSCLRISNTCMVSK